MSVLLFMIQLISFYPPNIYSNTNSIIPGTNQYANRKDVEVMINFSLHGYWWIVTLSSYFSYIGEVIRMKSSMEKVSLFLSLFSMF